MILQVIFDDQFGNYAIEQFKDFPDKVHFVLLTNGKTDNIKHIKNIPQKNIIVFQSLKYKELLAHLVDYKAVLMHGLFAKAQYDIVNHLPSNVKLAWVLWGGEIYSSKDSKLFRLAPLTRCLYTIKKIKNKIQGIQDLSVQVPIEIMRRVDFMLGSSLEIYEEAKAYINNPKMQHLQYSYFTLERLIGKDLIDKTVNGNNILLGNSAAVENNHMDILLRLKRVGIPRDVKLITPLSYNTPWVGVLINKVGRLMFRRQFYPLLSFMPREEYNQLVQSCSVFIANHHNPNAFGNVLTALWLGARVYSSKDNVQTRFLRRLGLHVDIIETDLNGNNPRIYSQLTDAEREENRHVIREMYGMDQMRKNIKTIVDTLNR